MNPAAQPSLTKDGLADPPVQRQEEVLHVLLHESPLEPRLVCLWDPEAVVDDDAVRDEGAQIRKGVPSRQCYGGLGEEEDADEIADTADEGEEVPCSPHEVRCGCDLACHGGGRADFGGLVMKFEGCCRIRCAKTEMVFLLLLCSRARAPYVE